MDKTAIIVLTICALIFGWWLVEEKKIVTAQAEAQQRYMETNRVAATPLPGTAANSPASPALATTAPSVFTNTMGEQTIVVTNARTRYTFSSLGGGLSRVDLLDYPEAISPRWKKTKVATDAVASLNTRAPVPILTVLGDDSLIGNGQFELTRNGNTVQARKTFADGLVMVKEFRISSNYLVNASVLLQNTSGKPVALPDLEYVTGTATPMDVDDNTMAEGVMWYNGSSSQDQTLSWFSGSGFGCFRGAPRPEFWAGSNNVVWISAHNQYFTLLAMPSEPASRIVARPVTLPVYSNVELNPNAPPPQGIQAALVYPAQMLAANSSIERQVAFYTGPKEYRTLADIGTQYSNHADQVMNFGSIWSFFAKMLLLAMNWLHDVTTLGYGAVIVLITVIIKVVFWPLTAASTRSMKRMQALSPELKALQEKYKDDAQKLTTKQWELYKKHKVNPLSGCLPMVIQMPVFFGFFTMIRSAIELRGAHFLWVNDLSKPDTLFMIPGLDWPFNLLPLLMGVAMLWQAHLTPPSPGMDPSQQKIMRYMPLLFLVFMYNYSSGLALYWTVNNLLTILQTKLTKNLKDPYLLTTVPTSNPALTPVSKLKK